VRACSTFNKTHKLTFAVGELKVAINVYVRGGSTEQLTGSKISLLLALTLHFN
jgi:hypothetical protein